MGSHARREVREPGSRIYSGHKLPCVIGWKKRIRFSRENQRWNVLAANFVDDRLIEHIDRAFEPSPRRRSQHLSRSIMARARQSLPQLLSTLVASSW
jgi:hypothetical protein